MASKKAGHSAADTYVNSLRQFVGLAEIQEWGGVPHYPAFAIGHWLNAVIDELRDKYERLDSPPSASAYTSWGIYWAHSIVMGVAERWGVLEVAPDERRFDPEDLWPITGPELHGLRQALAMIELPTPSPRVATAARDPVIDARDEFMYNEAHKVTKYNVIAAKVSENPDWDSISEGGVRDRIKEYVERTPGKKLPQARKKKNSKS